LTTAPLPNLLSLHDALPLCKVTECSGKRHCAKAQGCSPHRIAPNIGRPIVASAELEPRFCSIKDWQEVDASTARIGSVDLLPILDRKSTRLNSSHVSISYDV